MIKNAFRRGTPIRWDGLDYAIKIMNRKKKEPDKKSRIVEKYTGNTAVTPAKSRAKRGLPAAIKEQPDISGAELAREKMLERMLNDYASEVIDPENQYQSPVTPEKAYEHMTCASGAADARRRMLKKRGLK